MGMLKVVAGTVWALAIVALPSHAAPTATETSWPYQDELYVPVREWVKKVDESKNADGVKNKFATYSKSPRKVRVGAQAGEGRPRRHRRHRRRA